MREDLTQHDADFRQRGVEDHGDMIVRRERSPQCFESVRVFEGVPCQFGSATSRRWHRGAADGYELLRGDGHSPGFAANGQFKRFRHSRVPFGIGYRVSGIR